MIESNFHAAILIPTYNEALTIAELLESIKEFRSANPNFEVVVIDDNSPDNTATIVANLALPWVSILARPVKGGLGAAYRAGFTEVLASPKYSHVITMDADGSHRVADLAKIFTAIDINWRSDRDAKLIILGTRWIPGGAVVNWPLHRQLLSRAGTQYAKLALRIPLSDLTGGFRVYSVSLLHALKLDQMKATGYCYQIEMALASHLAGAREVEVPITFIERINGVSKMSRAIVIEALLQTTRWGLSRTLRPNADKLHYVK